MTIGSILFLAFAGVAAGLLGSLLGLGGGILIIPILVLVLKVPMHHAVATSLLCVIATSSAAASRNVRRGIANVRLGMTLEVATVLGALIGSTVAGQLSEKTLMITFACALFAMSPAMAKGIEDEGAEESDGDAVPDTRPRFFRAFDGAYFDAASESDVEYRVRRFPLAVGVSSFAGVLSGLLGIGGGVVKVPILTMFCDVPMKAAAATSNFMIGVTACASAFAYYGRGEISPVITAASVIGVFAGSRIGSVAAARIHGNSLRRAFAFVMILIAVQLIAKANGVWIR
jgi:uncharacterized membrane protein YfcA